MYTAYEILAWSSQEALLELSNSYKLDKFFIVSKD